MFGRYFESVYLGISFSNDDDQHRAINSNKNETPIAKIAAAFCIIFFTLLNCSGVRESAMLQRFLTSLKLLLVLILFIIAMIFIGNDSKIFLSNLSINKSFHGSNSAPGFFSAMIACLWSFDGWADLNFLMEEIINPEKQLPRIVLSSLCTVTVAYLLANIAYFSVLDTQTIMNSKSIGEYSIYLFYFRRIIFMSIGFDFLQ